MQEPSWDSSVGFLTSLEQVPAALATGALLDQARRWEGRVVPRTSMHDLLFTLPGEEYPFVNQLRVSWSEGTYQFWLLVDNVPVGTEAVPERLGESVLDAYLARLVGRT